MFAEKYPRMCANCDIYIIFAYTKFFSVSIWNERHIIHVYFDGYLREWLVNRLGSPVVFNRGSYENAIIKTYISNKVPNGDDAVTSWSLDMTPIVVPRIDGKSWKEYHYFGRRGAVKLVEAVETLFRIDLWKGCAGSVTGKSIEEDVENWCREHGISIEYRSAVKKKFYRMRNAYVKRGVVLGKTFVRKVKKT